MSEAVEEKLSIRISSMIALNPELLVKYSSDALLFFGKFIDWCYDSTSFSIGRFQLLIYHYFECTYQELVFITDQFKQDFAFAFNSLKKSVKIDWINVEEAYVSAMQEDEVGNLLEELNLPELKSHLKFLEIHLLWSHIHHHRHLLLSLVHQPLLHSRLLRCPLLRLIRKWLL
jgi:hypothetical protein